MELVTKIEKRRGNHAIVSSLWMLRNDTNVNVRRCAGAGAGSGLKGERGGEQVRWLRGVCATDMPTTQVVGGRARYRGRIKWRT